MKRLGRNSKLAGGLGLLLALSLIIALAVPVLAVPGPDAQFSGSAKVCNTAAAAGTVVSARIGSTQYGTTTVDALGNYVCMVHSDDPATPGKEGGVVGETVEFYFVGGGDRLAGTAQFPPMLTPVVLNLQATQAILTVNVNNPAWGSVTEPGSPGPFTYGCGTPVDLLAVVANAGYVFVNWTGQVGTVDQVTAADTFITMSGDYTIQANFAPTGAATKVQVETAANGTGTVVPAQAITTGNSITVYAITRDASNNFIANVAADVWSLENITGGVVAGDLVPSPDAKSAVFTGHALGSAQIKATSGALATTMSGVLTVTAVGATKVQVETKADGTGVVVPAQAITTGNSITVYAITRDASNNFVANVAAGAWSPENITGGVVAGDLVPSPDAKSAVFTGHAVGSAQIKATSGALATTMSGVLTVTAGAATKVQVETKADGTGVVVPAQAITPGNSITVYAITRDASNNFVANVAAAVWSLENITGGVVAGDLVPSPDAKSAVFTGHAVGSAQIRATSGALATTMSGVLTVTSATYTLTVNTTAGGTVTEPASPGPTPYPAGTPVDLLAVPKAHGQFLKWTGDVGTVDNVNAADTFITMNGNYTITANFSVWTLTLATGWNTISTPITLDPSCDTWGEFVALGNGLDFQTAYYFDGSVFQIPLASYPFSPCDALYVKMNSDDTAPIIPNPGATPPPFKNVVRGWNLVGSAFINDAGEWAVNDSLISLYYVGGELKPWGYNQVISPELGNQPGWVYPRPPEGAPGTPPKMLIGKGYWVSMENADRYDGWTTTPWSDP